MYFKWHNKSKFYSLIFDETIYVSQLSIILRYVDDGNNVHEQFVGFIICHDYAFKKEKICDKLDHAESEEENLEPKLTSDVFS